jgi:hypothetical protein
MYNVGLNDLPGDIIYEAVMLCIQRETFRPSVATIRDAAYEITHQSQMNATEAHSAVVALIHRYGSNAAPWINDDGTVRPWMRRPGPPTELDDLPAAVRKSIDSFGGWIAVCETTSPSSIFRSQFIATYDALTVSRADIDTRAAQRRFEAQHKAMISSQWKELEGGK